MSACHAFSTRLGWMALETDDRRLKRLVFGYANRRDALAALGVERANAITPAVEPLIDRLQRYAQGAADDFLDVDIVHAPRTPFARRVLEECRQIPLGETISYAELARRAGSPGAARAAGGVMASNQIPLIIPCHRVVGSGGRLGGYSAPGGLATKQRLLDLEAEARLVSLVC